MPPLTHVTVTSGELPALRARMRDAQTAAAEYYGMTARTSEADELGGPVRRFLDAAQAVNDLLTNAVADKATYRRLFDPPAAGQPSVPGTGVVKGMKYVRNVSQHVPHVIEPQNPHALIGGLHGMHGYSSWAAVPAVVHAQLYPSSQRLKPDYDDHLLDQEVTGTMLDTLAFYAGAVPDIPHRTGREWTGFPLQDQPGVGNRLHPEEPTAEAEARRWLDGRLPGGDARVVVGQLTVDGTRYVYGHTFTSDLTYGFFTESIAQAARDVATRFPYVVGDVLANADDVTHLHRGRPEEGLVLRSRSPLQSWTSPLPLDGWTDDWTHSRQESWWDLQLRLELPSSPLGATYITRRARRLNASVPWNP